MKAKEIKRSLIKNINLQLQKTTSLVPVPVIWGPPGIGKSSIVTQTCHEMGYRVVTRYLSNTINYQLSGLPIITDGEVRWSVPDVIDVKSEDASSGNETPTVLFLDDIHLSSGEIQKYLFQLLLQRALNHHTLPANTAIVLAGNRIEDLAGGKVLNSGVTSRLLHVYMEFDKESLIEHFKQKKISKYIIEYLEMANEEDIIDQPAEGVPFASPRGWEFLHTILQQEIENHPRPQDLRYIEEVCKGTIGERVGGKFFNFLHNRISWDINEVLPKIQKYINIDQAQKFSLIQALLDYLQQGKDINEEKLKTINEFLLELCNKQDHILVAKFVFELIERGIPEEIVGILIDGIPNTIVNMVL